MDFAVLAQLLFPNVTKTPEEIEALYPKRELPEGAKVTRFAPSPTGFVHFGGLFPATVGERLAHQSGGVFYLRIEDTDAKREVEGAAEGLITTLARYGVHFDEGACLNEDGTIGSKGNYGPYKQSERVELYHVYAKKLVEEGKAYPCFTTAEELEKMQSSDRKSEIKAKEWTEEAMAEQMAEMRRQREITLDEVKAHLAAGDPFVLRMLADGDSEKKIKFTDLIKGNLELPENDKDEVLLKSDGVPTYHFAHAVDDHLMGTTHVIRGEEWLPSLPRHIMLFRYLGFKLPKYMHIAQIMRLDENGNKKKLSKRDMGANMDDYFRLGYCADCVCEYVMTLLNSNYEEWHTANADKPYTEFPFNIKKMSTSGCLFDFNKLNDVSKNVLSRMTADEIYTKYMEWATIFEPEFAALLAADPAKAKAIFAIGRGGKKPRKDFTTWQDVKPYMDLFYNDTFHNVDEIPEQYSVEDVKNALSVYLENSTDFADNNAWFEYVKSVAEKSGFCPDVKLYKQSPESYKGHVGDVSTFVRLAVAGKLNSPDLFEIIRIIGREEADSRIQNFIKNH